MTVALTQDDINRLKHVIELGVTTKREIKALQESLKETVDSVSKELELEKKDLNDVIKMAYEAEEKGGRDVIVQERQDRLDKLHDLLVQAGRK